MADWETVRRLAGTWPGVVEGTSYGTPALKAKGKLFVRLREDGETLVVRILRTDRPARLRTDPEVFYLTDHYVDHPWILVRLPVADEEDLAELLDDAWRLTATKRMIEERDGR